METESRYTAVLKNDATPLTVLLSLTLITRLDLIANAPFVYYFDSYAFVSQAVNFISSGTVRFGVGMPFTVSLGGFCYVFGSVLGVLSASRLLMLLMSALLVSMIYLIGRKMSGKIFGFIVALIAIFEPLFLSYSIVPHDDVFAIALGLSALFFATSNANLSYVLSPIFFYLAVFTRPELFLVLVVPVLFLSFSKFLKIRSYKTVFRFLFYFFAYFPPFIWVYATAQNYTRFGIIEKFTLFLTPTLLKSTLNYTFSFYTQPLLSQVVFLFIVLSTLMMTFKGACSFLVFQKKGRFYSAKLDKDGKAKRVLLADQTILAFSVFLVFILFIVVITVYGYTYSIVDGKLQIIDYLPDRYLILPRLLLSYPLAYPLSMVIKKLYAEVTSQK